MVLVSAALTAGCASKKEDPGDGGGMQTPGILLLPDATGWVDRANSGTSMVQGAWYAYADAFGPDGTAATGDCQVKGGHPTSACSVVVAPTYGSFPNTDGVMCTNGTAAVVPMITGTTMPDYSNVWGAGIGLDLNNSGGDAGVKMPWNATANGITGISFDFEIVGGTALPPGGLLRVELPTPTTATAAAYWDGSAEFSPVKIGHNEFKWSAVEPPFFAPANPPPPAFDPTMIVSLQFHVPTNTGGPVPFNYCVKNVKALTE